jgi:hypothetical protein
MRRRTLLQWLAAAAPIAPLRVWAQTAGFPGKHASLLRAIAAVVLPSELGRDGVDRVVARFEAWVREYRPGADTDHGYGRTYLRRKPASPAPVYVAQLESLSATMLGSDTDAKRAAIEHALAEAKVQELPRLPDGKHVISDLMSFYFRGSDANDLCYRAAIERDRCRGLEDSAHPPPPLKGAG